MFEKGQDKLNFSLKLVLKTYCFSYVLIHDAQWSKLLNPEFSKLISGQNLSVFSFCLPSKKHFLNGFCLFKSNILSGGIEPHVLKLFWGWLYSWENSFDYFVFLIGITSILHSKKPSFIENFPKIEKRYDVYCLLSCG